MGVGCGAWLLRWPQPRSDNDNDIGTAWLASLTVMLSEAYACVHVAPAPSNAGADEPMDEISMQEYAQDVIVELTKL